MQVFAVGKFPIYPDLSMQTRGFMWAKPKVGGLGHDVIKCRNRAFSYKLNYRRVCHRIVMV